LRDSSARVPTLRTYVPVTASNASLEQLALDLRVSDRVWFPGRVTEEEKLRLYAAADVHAMPSVRHGPMIEGFGFVFLEAGAAGLPSVCGVVGGQREAVLDGETGLAVDGTDPEAVHSALSRLVHDAGLRRRLGDRGRAFAQERDWERVVPETRAALLAFILPNERG
jgi:phosphatidyl-myo-inositol dimannoside synthase